jgi:hypothetical protein
MLKEINVITSPQSIKIPYKKERKTLKPFLIKFQKKIETYLKISTNPKSEPRYKKFFNKVSVI